MSVNGAQISGWGRIVNISGVKLFWIWDGA